MGVTKHEDKEKINPLSEENAAKLQKAHTLADRPDKFAETFEKAAQSQVKIKETLKKEIRDILATDVDARASLKNVIRQVEKEELWIYTKKFGFAVWTVGSIIIGAVIQAIISSKIR